MCRGFPGVSEKEVVHAATLANAHDFITAFPDGYQTDVGSLGSKLSGGQRQRIAIARTLIAKPKILILDEATSALDSKSETKFQDLLEQTKHTRASIVIAHRMRTIRNADEIIVLDNGGVVERGNHESLVAHGGAYAAMVMEQGHEEHDKNGDAGDDAIDEEHPSAPDSPQRDAVRVKSNESQKSLTTPDAAVAEPTKKGKKVNETAEEKAQRVAEGKAARAWAWSFNKQDRGWIWIGMVCACIHVLYYIDVFSGVYVAYTVTKEFSWRRTYG